MKTPIVINEWGIISDRSVTPYMAPELIKQRVIGKLANGKLITTSCVVEYEGRQFETESGSLYRFGKVSKSYLDFLKTQNIKLNNLCPFKSKAN